MIATTVNQDAIINSTFKKIDWLFVITLPDNTTYHWSTKNIPAGSILDWSGAGWRTYVHWSNEDNHAYEFKIADFTGIQMYRSKAELGVVAATNLTFSIINKNSQYNPRAFEGGIVKIAVRVSNGTESAVLRRWRFVIKKTEPEYQSFRVICEDWLQHKLRGDYPNTELVQTLWDTDDAAPTDNVCVPLPFGTVYVPIRSIYVSNNVSITGTDIKVSASTSGSRSALIRTGATDFKTIGARRYITVSGFTDPANNGTFMVVGASAQLIALAEDSGLVTEAAGDTVTITQGSRYYVLGSPSKTYSITEVRSPRRWGRKSTWGVDTTKYPTWQQAAQFASLTDFQATNRFTQSTLTDDDGVTWRVFQPIIDDSNNDGTLDACGVWQQGDTFLDCPTKFSRSDTSSMTNPSDILQYIITDIGLENVDHGSFATARQQYNDWGLTWNGALWYKQQRKALLSKLLVMCHSNLVTGESIELHPLSAVPKMIITAAEILKPADLGVGSFRYSDVRADPADDCGYIAWQKTGEAQDAFIKTLVPVKVNVYTRISREVCELPWVQDSQNAQRLGMFYFQRKLASLAEVSFTAKGNCLMLNPGDMVRIQDENLTGHRYYGGGATLQWGGDVTWPQSTTSNTYETYWDSLNYNVVIDNMTIRKDLSIDFSCTRHSVVLYDWDQVVPPAISPSADDITKLWQPALSGPLSDEYQNIEASLPWKTYLTVSPIGKADYQNIQEAVNALADSNANGIFMKSGDYYLDQMVDLPGRNMEIIGESRGSVNIYSSKTPGPNYGSHDPAFRIYNKGSSYYFSSFKIISRSAASQIYYENGSGNTYDHAHIWVYNPGANDCSVTINDAEFLMKGERSDTLYYSAGDNAIQARADSTEGNQTLRVTNCYCRKSDTGNKFGARAFVVTRNWNNVFVENNVIEDTAEEAIYIKMANFAQVLSNSMNNITGYAISVTNSAGFKTSARSGGAYISHNIINYRPLDAPMPYVMGINATALNYLTIANNSIVVSSCPGDSLQLINIGQCEGRIIGNSVSFTSSRTAGGDSCRAISLSASHYSQVIGNSVYFNHGYSSSICYGIYLDTSTRCSVSSNFVDMVNVGHASQVGVVIDNASGNCYGSDNIVINAATAASNTSGSGAVIVNGVSY